MKILSDRGLDMPSFLVVTYMKQQPFAGSLSTYGIGKVRQEGSGLSLACLLSVACLDDNPKDLPA